MFVGYGRRAADKNQIPLPGGHARVRTRQRSAKALRKAGRTALVVCNAPYARVLRRYSLLKSMYCTVVYGPPGTRSPWSPYHQPNLAPA